MIGKSVFVWGIDYPYWTAEKIAAELAAKGYESAILHDTSVWNWRSGELSAPRLRLIKLLKAAGIEIYGCAAVYGNDSVAEGRIAAELCEQYNLQGFIFDAEGAWDNKDTPNSNAVKLLRKFREGTQVLSGWCYWSFWASKTGTSYATRDGGKVSRKDVIWAATAKNYGECDFVAPMMYWDPGTDAASAVEYLEKSWKQYRQITDKPIVPIGRAYNGNGGTATAEACTAFDKRARELGATGQAWWALQYAVKIPGVYEAISAVSRFGDEQEPTPEPEPEPELTDKQKLDILWKEYEDKQ